MKYTRGQVKDGLMFFRYDNRRVNNEYWCKPEIFYKKLRTRVKRDAYIRGFSTCYRLLAE
jgi:hypothetical protein